MQASDRFYEVSKRTELIQLNSDQTVYYYQEESMWPRQHRDDKCKHKPYVRYFTAVSLFY